MILLHQLQNIADVYLHLLHQLHLKYQVVVDDLLFVGCPGFVNLLIQGVVPSQVVLLVHLGYQLLLWCELVKGAQQVPQFQDDAKEAYELLLLFLIHDVGYLLHRVFL